MGSFSKYTKKIAKLVLLLGLILSLLAIETRCQADEALLWRARGPSGCEIYLFGSLHLVKDSIYPLKNVIMEAFNSSSRLIVELDPDSAKLSGSLVLLFEKGYYPPGETLMEHLSPELRSLMEPHIAIVPSGADNNMKPWLLSMVLDLIYLQKLGYSEALGVDKYLIGEAKDKGMPIFELETPEQQLNIFANMSEEHSELFLKYTILELNMLESIMDKIEAAWVSGDENAFVELIFQNYSQYPEFAPLMEQVIFDRNYSMLESILPFCNEPGVSFAVIGAAHLVGPLGIPALLEQRGYVLEKY
ncbi:MAG: TraB/GumN family protein [Deltaproteobacteria bacterium]|jgi:uncharacterized protein YbaP (TraB family)|nr:TraB/GumN family protein [Deltaproteobacteria bacterium]